ncbi:hypothetical protein DUI87_02958 [Hirundo rustica rustica]|uniref:Uncharacterized protein n=1 Tax=Hirundo rustica rustica TaxID=333673 RepID=A0A3M0LAP4_HIRRU|nr:hypothetical protein DUI87_02958 [Hirundo rustica rustica]
MELAQTGFFTPRNQHLILGVLVALSLSLPVDGWVVPQPKANVLATLAKAMNQDHICLSATSANNPLSTCLVGIPFRLNEFPPIFLQKMRSANQVRSNYLSPEFRYNTYPVRNPFAFWVQYLQGLLSLSSDPTDLELLGSVNASFCIKFVYTPPKGQEQNYRHVRPVNMPDDWCEEKVKVIRPTSFGSVAVTIFLPWVAIAKSLGELAHLECWVAKQANLTSEALSNLLNEEEITRQATLQNRVAIDYLLLLHGHQCEEFEGFCCFNLTSRAEDVHAAIQKMKEMVGNLKRETEDWLGGLFANWGISGWVSSIIKTVLLFNHVTMPSDEDHEEEGLELEEVLEGTPEDEERNPDEEEHGLGYPTQHH